jgi:hypothetical protein
MLGTRRINDEAFGVSGERIFPSWIAARRVDARRALMTLHSKTARQQLSIGTVTTGQAMDGFKYSDGADASSANIRANAPLTVGSAIKKQWQRIAARPAVVTARERQSN